MSRWIALKIIDGEEKILKTITNKLRINLNDIKMIEASNKIDDILNSNGVEKEKVKDKIISSIVFMAENVSKDVIQLENDKYNLKDRKIDKILTSKLFGIPIMIGFLGVILWLTITGANYPSQLLMQTFNWLQEKIVYTFEIISVPIWLEKMLIEGVYKTLTWIIAVMLPPMAIFFPLFTLLEDLGFLPRIAFNLDKYFRKAGSSRKASTNNVYGFWM